MVYRSSRMIQQLPEGEYSLLMTARALTAPGHPEGIDVLSRRAAHAPEKLSPAAMRLLRQTLATCGVQQLALRGGWRSEVSLDGSGGVRRGRLWERHKRLPPLLFGAPSYQLCRWLAAGSPADNARRPSPEALSGGDELLYFLAVELSRGSELMTALARLESTRRSVLAWLSASEELFRGGPCPLTEGSFSGLLGGDDGVALEALGPSLTQSWIEGERRKQNMTDPEALIALGAAQQRVLDGLLTALDAARRRDLATFLVDAAVELLSLYPSAQDLAGLYRGHLDPKASLGRRQEALQGALAFLRALGRISAWHEEYRYVRAFDDEYEEAQALLLRWEPLGHRGFALLEATIREVERLDSALSGEEPL